MNNEANLSPTVLRVYGGNLALKKRPSKEAQARNELAHASMLRSMNHSHLTRVFDVKARDDNIYTLMPWCGIDLYTYIIEQENMCTPAIFHAVYVDMRSALRHMHDVLHYCHGDVKLENIMCPGNNYLDTKYKLCDYGSIVHSTTTMMPNNVVLGTLHYQAPEIHFEKQIDYMKTDMWSLGVSLYGIHFRRFLGSVDLVKSWYRSYAYTNANYHMPLKLIPCDIRNKTRELSRYQEKVLKPLLYFKPGIRRLV